LDAVQAAVVALEDDPLFDAGHGSYPTTTGTVEMDAIIVNGISLNFGAVAALRNAANPILVARRVLEATPHALLVGEGAGDFARQQGFEHVEDAQLAAAQGPPSGQGTVGAVAIDALGNVAAATSTGGMKGQMPGRVGDSPLIGCGAAAENGIGAASATGWGEPMMKVMLSRTVLDFMREGAQAQEAARRAIALLEERTGCKGGVICVDAEGRVGMAHNTLDMAHGWTESEAPVRAALQHLEQPRAGQSSSK
jgi:beta-aspartyl-peptidase (threonine type)